MTFPDRYVLSDFDDGAVLFDLQSGTLFQLNATAAMVWRLNLSGSDPDAIARSLMDRFTLEYSAAREDVNRVLAAARSEAQWDVLPTNCRYELGSHDCYRLIVDDSTALEVRLSALGVRKKRPLAPHELDLYLRIIAPKIISLSGSSVLHASAVTRPDGTAVAFLGKSGAGKTTTARMFGRAGWSVLCEDKLVVEEHDGRLCAIVGAEPRIATWILNARSGLAAAPIDVWYDAEPLAQTASGPTRTLTDFFILDAQRRVGAAFDLERLSQASAVAEIFQHSFFGSAASERWRHHIHLASQLARQATTYRATAPASLEALELETRRYVLSRTS